MKKNLTKQRLYRRLVIGLQVLVLATASFVPYFNGHASAASEQITNRSVSSTTAVPGATTQLGFTFTTSNKGGSTNIKQVELEFCDQPLGACTISNTPNVTGATSSSIGGGWAGSGTTTTNQNGRTSGTSNNQTKIVITTAGNENNKAGLTITLPSVVNKNVENLSYYIRMRFYSDTGTTEEWYGNVAQSTSQTLTIYGRVQELLSFCVGSTLVDDATASIVPDCSTASGTSVDLGTITSAGIAVTPVGAVTGGDDMNAYAMVQTNAVNGVAISYHSLQNISSGKLKVVGATCSGTSTSDQCFNSQGNSQGTFTAGTENFGMTVAGINCASVPGGAYTCTFASGCTNLQPQADYTGDTYTYSSTCVGAGTFGTSNGYAWDDTGSAHTIASSASSNVKVVSNEAIVLKFAATAQVTTPTGLYQAQADFIATPTF